MPVARTTEFPYNRTGLKMTLAQKATKAKKRDAVSSVKAEILRRIGEALIGAACHGADIERGDDCGNTTGRILKVDATRGTVRVELYGMGPAARTIEFTLP